MLRENSNKVNIKEEKQQYKRPYLFQLKNFEDRLKGKKSKLRSLKRHNHMNSTQKEEDYFGLVKKMMHN